MRSVSGVDCQSRLGSRVVTGSTPQSGTINRILSDRRFPFLGVPITAIDGAVWADNFAYPATTRDCSARRCA
jgi:hypothetical protein